MSRVDGVIAALRVAEAEANASSDDEWKVSFANRWITQLPWSYIGRWRHLMLEGDSWGKIETSLFVSHVRATAAYLEANRDAINAMRPWSPLPSTPLKPQQPLASSSPVNAVFKEVKPDLPALEKSKKGVRLIKK
jgi:hypothetical protein